MLMQQAARWLHLRFEPGDAYCIMHIAAAIKCISVLHARIQITLSSVTLYLQNRLLPWCVTYSILTIFFFAAFMSTIFIVFTRV